MTATLAAGFGLVGRVPPRGVRFGNPHSPFPFPLSNFRLLSVACRAVATRRRMRVTNLPASIFDLLSSALRPPRSRFHAFPFCPAPQVVRRPWSVVAARHLRSAICDRSIDRKLEAMIQEKGNASELVLDGHLIGEQTTEVNLAELLDIARKEFNVPLPRER